MNFSRIAYLHILMNNKSGEIVTAMLMSCNVVRLQNMHIGNMQSALLKQLIELGFSLIAL